MFGPTKDRSDRAAFVVLAAAIAFRVVAPLAVLAASPGSLLQGLPPYRFNPLLGDAYGYYFGTREILTSWQRRGSVLLPAAVAAVLIAVVVYRRARGSTRALLYIWLIGALAALICGIVRVTGVPQIGWPLVWSVPLLPYRSFGFPLDPKIAYGFGLTLTLVCNVVTVLATFQLGLIANLRRLTAALAALAVALWPLLLGLTGADVRANGTWLVDLGLALYTEPLSTALVAVAIVLVCRRGAGQVDAAWAGALLGLSVLVRVSNVFIAVVVFATLLVTGRRRQATVLAIGGLAWLPAVALFWPKGYPKLEPPVFPAHPFAIRYLNVAWTDSTVWRPLFLLALVPMAIFGATRLPRYLAGLLGASVIVTAAFYSFYELTPQHPRFLFVLVPMLAVLWLAGAEAATVRLRALYDRAT